MIAAVRHPKTPKCRGDQVLATVDGRHVLFTAAEMDLFAALFNARGRVVPYRDLHELTYGLLDDGGPNIEVLKVHACRLRQKLAATQFIIETWHGVGYALRRIERLSSLCTESTSAPRSAAA
jgi:DNA-binding response OmpR family regulator